MKLLFSLAALLLVLGNSCKQRDASQLAGRAESKKSANRGAKPSENFAAFKSDLKGVPRAAYLKEEIEKWFKQHNAVVKVEKASFFKSKIDLLGILKSGKISTAANMNLGALVGAGKIQVFAAKIVNGKNLDWATEQVQNSRSIDKDSKVAKNVIAAIQYDKQLATANVGSVKDSRDAFLVLVANFRTVMRELAKKHEDGEIKWGERGTYKKLRRWGTHTRAVIRFATATDYLEVQCQGGGLFQSERVVIKDAENQSCLYENTGGQNRELHFAGQTLEVSILEE